MASSGVTKTVSRMSSVVRGVMLATSRHVLVGVPSTTAGNRSSGPINNAALAYIHDNGAPEANIPARPFMHPGLDDISPEIKVRMVNIGEAAIQGRADAVDKGLHALGLVAASSIKNRITSNIPPPLSPRTVAGRARQRGTGTRRKGERDYLDLVASGVAPGVAQAKAGIVALIDTGQMRNAITYVLRDAD